MKYPKCPKCGDSRQVWLNQLTHKLTCHRAFCHTEIDDLATDLAYVDAEIAKLQEKRRQIVASHSTPLTTP
jgi:hypothetical protein